MSTRLAALMAAGLFAVAAQAHDYAAGSLRLLHPHAAVPSHEGDAVAVYLTVENRGGTSDRLIAVTSDAATQVQLHVPGGAGSDMHAAPGLEIPPGARVELRPQGPHVMVEHVDRPLAAGDRFPLRLVFQRAGAVQVDVVVGPAGTDAAAASTGHHH